jgi:hypothetical protein
VPKCAPCDVAPHRSSTAYAILLLLFSLFFLSFFLFLLLFFYYIFLCRSIEIRLIRVVCFCMLTCVVVVVVRFACLWMPIDQSFDRMMLRALTQSRSLMVFRYVAHAAAIACASQSYVNSFDESVWFAYRSRNYCLDDNSWDNAAALLRIAIANPPDGERRSVRRRD